MSNSFESAAKIRQIGGENEVDRFTIRQLGNEIANNLFANLVYSHLQKHNTLVTLDFISRPLDKYAETFINRNEIKVYMQNHNSAQAAVASLIHESSHVDRHRRRIPQNTQYEEYVAFRREEFYKQGRRPTFAQRADLWETAKEQYPELPTGCLPSFLAKQETADRAKFSLQINTSNPETLEKRVSIGWTGNSS